MSTIVTRAGKGSSLTWTEMDSNLTNLNTDKLEVNPALGTPVSGNLTNCTGLPAAGVTGTALVISNIGSTVQAYDVLLTTFAELTPAANKIPSLAASDIAAWLDFKDEDNMASNSATALPSQQSVKAYVDSKPINSTYVSSEQTITSAGALTIAHGIGAKPKIVTAYLVCKTAEAGYSIGDEVFVNVGGDETYSLGHGFALTRSSTNLEVRFGSDANVFAMLNKTTGTRVNLTNANWTIVFQAFF